MSEPRGTALLQRAWQAALVVLVTAFTARVVWELLKPLLPAFCVFALLLGIYGVLRGRR